MDTNLERDKKNSIINNSTFKMSLVIIGVLLIVIIGMQIYAKHLVSKRILYQLPEHITLSYEDLDLNILFGNMMFNNLKLKYLNAITKRVEAEIDLETLKIKDVSYWAFWQNKQLKTDVVNVENAHVMVFKKDSEAIRFSANNLSFNLYEFMTDSLKLQNKIPFKYQGFKFDLTDLYLDLSRFERLKVASLSYKNNNLKFNHLDLGSKYDKKELSEKLIQERDYVDFKMEYGVSTLLKLKQVEDTFQISAETFRLKNSELHLFRDKLLPDDTSKKPLYATQLRNLPIHLEIEIIFIENANVYYSERVDPDIKPESICFEHLDAEINNLSNINKAKTEVAVNTKIMGKAPLEFNLEFNTFDTGDTFNASAVLKNLEAATINPFLESQARVRALGQIHEMYFTIHGNDNRSLGDMKMKYEDFKFSILNEDQLRINKTLSTVVNIFTNDGSKTDEKGYRYGDINVNRDKTKSFFNYLWINTKDGLKRTVVGNGKL